VPLADFWRYIPIREHLFQEEEEEEPLRPPPPGMRPPAGIPPGIALSEIATPEGMIPGGARAPQLQPTPTPIPTPVQPDSQSPVALPPMPVPVQPTPAPVQPTPPPVVRPQPAPGPETWAREPSLWEAIVQSAEAAIEPIEELFEGLLAPPEPIQPPQPQEYRRPAAPFLEELAASYGLGKEATEVSPAITTLGSAIQLYEELSGRRTPEEVIAEYEERVRALGGEPLYGPKPTREETLALFQLANERALSVPQIAKIYQLADQAGMASREYVAAPAGGAVQTAIDILRGKMSVHDFATVAGALGGVSPDQDLIERTARALAGAYAYVRLREYEMPWLSRIVAETTLDPFGLVVNSLLFGLKPTSRIGQILLFAYKALDKVDLACNYATMTPEQFMTAMAFNTLVRLGIDFTGKGLARLSQEWQGLGDALKTSRNRAELERELLRWAQRDIKAEILRGVDYDSATNIGRSVGASPEEVQKVLAEVLASEGKTAETSNPALARRLWLRFAGPLWDYGRIQQKYAQAMLEGAKRDPHTLDEIVEGAKRAEIPGRVEETLEYAAGRYQPSIERRYRPEVVEEPKLPTEPPTEPLRRHVAPRERRWGPERPTPKQLEETVEPEEAILRFWSEFGYGAMSPGEFMKRLEQMEAEIEPRLPEEPRPAETGRPPEEYRPYGEPPELQAYFTEADIEPMSPVDARWTFGTDEAFRWRDRGDVQKGRPLNIEEVPEVVYHATVDLPTVLKQGVLRGQVGGGGLGGGQRSGVSVTTKAEEALLIVREFRRAAEIARGGDLSVLLPQWAREDARLAGLPEDALDKLAQNFVREYQWRQKEYPQYGADNAWTSYRTYLITRQSAGGPRNPILYGTVEQYAALDPEKLGVLSIPRENLYASGALVVPRDDALSEIRVYGDVPVRDAQVVDLTTGRPLPAVETRPSEEYRPSERPLETEPEMGKRLPEYPFPPGAYTPEEFAQILRDMEERGRFPMGTGAGGYVEPGRVPEFDPTTLHPAPELGPIVRDALAWRYLTAKQGRMARKSDLDDWLMDRFGLSEIEARDISNYIESHYPFSFRIRGGRAEWSVKESGGMPEPKLSDYPDLAVSPVSRAEEVEVQEPRPAVSEKPEPELGEAREEPLVTARYVVFPPYTAGPGGSDKRRRFRQRLRRYRERMEQYGLEVRFIWDELGPPEFEVRGTREQIEAAKEGTKRLKLEWQPERPPAVAERPVPELGEPAEEPRPERPPAVAERPVPELGEAREQPLATAHYVVFPADTNSATRRRLRRYAERMREYGLHVLPIWRDVGPWGKMGPPEFEVRGTREQIEAAKEGTKRLQLEWQPEFEKPAEERRPERPPAIAERPQPELGEAREEPIATARYAVFPADTDSATRQRIRRYAERIKQYGLNVRPVYVPSTEQEVGLPEFEVFGSHEQVEAAKEGTKRLQLEWQATTEWQPKFMRPAEERRPERPPAAAERPEPELERPLEREPRPPAAAERPAPELGKPAERPRPERPPAVAERPEPELGKPRERERRPPAIAERPVPELGKPPEEERRPPAVAERPVPELGDITVPERKTFPEEKFGPEPHIVVATGPDPNKGYEFVVDVVPEDELVTSHSWTGEEHIEYPRNLQPRISRADRPSREQIAHIAATLQPRELTKGLDIDQPGTLDTGAPIVADHLSPDGEPITAVESGNARVEAIRLAKEQFPDRYEDYQVRLLEELKRYPDLAAKAEDLIEEGRAPIAVRHRVSDVDPEAFVDEANVPAVQAYTPADQAGVDARRYLTDDIVRSLDVERDEAGVEQQLRAQPEFVRGFVKKLPQREQAVDERGEPTPQTIQRLANALLAKAFPGPEGEELRKTLTARYPTSIQQGVLDAAPQLAVAETLIAAGERDPSLSIAKDLAKVVNVLTIVEDSNTTVAKWLTKERTEPRLPGVESVLTPVQEALLEALDTVRRQPAAVREFLRAYARKVVAEPTLTVKPLAPEMAPISKTKADLIREASTAVREREEFVGTLFELADKVKDAGLDAEVEGVPRYEITPQRYPILRGFIESEPGWYVAERAQEAYLADLIIADIPLPRKILQSMGDPLGIVLERIDERLEDAVGKERAFLQEQKKRIQVLLPLSAADHEIATELLSREKKTWTTSTGPDVALYQALKEHGLVKDKRGFYATPQGSIVLKNLGTELEPRIRVTIEPARYVEPYALPKPPLLLEEEGLPYPLEWLPEEGRREPTVIPMGPQEPPKPPKPPTVPPEPPGEPPREPPEEPEEDSLQKLFRAMGIEEPLPEDWHPVVKNMWQKMVEGTFDRFEPARRLQKETGIPIYDELCRMSGVAEHVNVLRINDYDPIFRDFKTVEESLRFWAYLLTYHLEDVKTAHPDYELPAKMTLDEVLDARAKLQAEWGEEKTKTIDRKARDFWALNAKNFMNPSVETGYISRAQADTMLKKYPHYLPLYREGYENLGFWFGVAQARAYMPSQFSKALSEEGSERPLRNIAEGYFQALYIHTQRNWRNMAAKSLVRALQRACPDEVHLLKKIVTEEGVKRARESVPPEYGVIRYREDGNIKAYVVPKPWEILATGADVYAMGAIENAFRTLSAIKRAIVTEYNPAWVAVNMISDSPEVFWRHQIAGFFDPRWWKGFLGALTRGDVNQTNAFMRQRAEAYRRAAEAGAFAGSIFHTTLPPGAEYKKYSHVRIKFNSVADVVLALPRLIARINQAVEAAPKLAAFEKLERDLLKSGAELDHDAVVRLGAEAARSTFNWDMGGNVMKLMGRMFWPMNAMVQVPYQSVQALWEKPSRGLWLLGLASIPTTLLFAYNRQFDSFAKVPSYEYLNNWVIIIAEEEREPDPRYPTQEKEVYPVCIDIPKRGFVQALSAPFEVLLREMDASDRHYVENIFDAVLQGVAGMVPALANPIAATEPHFLGGLFALDRNYDDFRKQPIVPEAEYTTRPPEWQFGPEQSQLAIAIGQLFKVSPRKVEFLLHDSYGEWGRAASWLSDVLVGALGEPVRAPGEDRRRTLTKTEALERVPIVRRFVSTRGTQLLRTGYAELDASSERNRRLLYENEEVRRLGLGIHPPGNEITVRGVPIRLTPQQRTAINEIYGPLAKRYVDEVTSSPTYQEMHDVYRVKEINKAKERAMKEAKAQVLGTDFGAEIPYGLLAPERVQRLYKRYTGISPYIGILQDPATGVPRFVDLDADMYERISDAKSWISTLRQTMGISTQQAALYYAMQTGDWLGSLLSMMMQIRVNPAKAEYWETYPELQTYYPKTEESSYQSPVVPWIESALTS